MRLHQRACFREEIVEQAWLGWTIPEGQDQSAGRSSRPSRGHLLAWLHLQPLRGCHSARECLPTRPFHVPGSKGRESPGGQAFVTLSFWAAVELQWHSLPEIFSLLSNTDFFLNANLLVDTCSSSDTFGHPAKACKRTAFCLLAFRNLVQWALQIWKGFRMIHSLLAFRGTWPG